GRVIGASCASIYGLAMNGMPMHPPKRSTIEDMVVDLRDARLAPAGRNIARVEEERAGCAVLPGAVARDLGDGDSIVPLRTLADRGHPAAAHETELAFLVDDAAQALGKAARIGAVDHDMRDRKLAGKRFAARFEIDRAGKAAQFGVDFGGLGRCRN